MIDFHAHAFPDASWAMQKLVGDTGLGSALKRASGLFSRGLGVLHETVMLSKLPLMPSIENVAALRHALPSQWEERVEHGRGLALAGGMVVGGTLDGLIASMDRNGIEKTVLIGAPPIASNRWLLDEAVRQAPRRLIPVATLPPAPSTGLQQGAWEDAYEALVSEGARGFKIHSNMDGLSSDHPAYRALFAVADRRGLFVILHTGHFHVPMFKRPGPVDLESFRPLFDAHPNVPVCLAHMNRYEPERAWELMRHYPQLYADTSWQPADKIRQAIAEVGADRLVLGSDWPLLHLGLQADAIRSLRGAASEEDVDTISRRTPEKFLARTGAGTV